MAGGRASYNLAANREALREGAMSTSMCTGRRLKVGVLVDLALTEAAGGHVKCWQRIAEAAVGCADRLDLTVHFSGPQPRRIELSPSVRYIVLPPVLSTSRLVREVPDHTDLAPWHPRLARALPDYDVIHTTDAFFCYARTATRFARRRGVPVVSSIHTNTPEYARITTSGLLERALGRGPAYRAANDCLRLPVWVEAVLRRRLARHLACVTSVMAGYGAPEAEDCGVALRRGFDRALFDPARRARGPVHLFCAGAGSERAALEDALGAALTCSGPLDQDELARAYASADLFLFPSMIDEAGNAAIEALASGLPALLAAGSGVATRMADCLGLQVLPGDRPEPWAAAIIELAAAPTRRAEMGKAARAYVEASVPSWADILAEDLLPVWQDAAGGHA